MISDLFASIADFSDLIPILSILILRNDSKYQFLCYWLLTSAIILISTYFIAEKSINNLMLYNLYGILELLFVGRLITINIRSSITLITILQLAGIIIGVYFLSSEPNGFNSLARSISNFILIITCYYYLFDLFKNQNINLKRSISFWFVVSYLVYFSSSFFTHLLLSEVLATKQTNLFYNSWTITSTTFILKNIVLAVALFKIKKDE